MVSEMDGGEDYFCIDSKPIEVCRIARSKRCSMGKKDFGKAPGVATAHHKACIIMGINSMQSVG